MRDIIKEACVETLDEAILAEKKGANRVELCSRLELGGLTPNRKLVKQVFNALNKDIPSIISIFAGRIANAGIDPEPTMIYASELVKNYPEIETLWASSREVFNIFQAERSGTDIITLPPNLVSGMKDIGRDLDDYSLDTVKMFYDDSVKAGYKI